MEWWAAWQQFGNHWPLAPCTRLTLGEGLGYGVGRHVVRK